MNSVAETLGRNAGLLIQANGCKYGHRGRTRASRSDAKAGTGAGTSAMEGGGCSRESRESESGESGTKT